MGAELGVAVGTVDGLFVGASDGRAVGPDVGIMVGICVGLTVGEAKLIKFTLLESSANRNLKAAASRLAR